MRETATNVYIHMVWATWDRLPLLVGESKTNIYRQLQFVCTQQKTQLIGLGGIVNHVHLLVRIPTTVTIADLVKYLKGTSAYYANENALDGQFFKWQGAYRAFTVSPHDVPATLKYIQNQEQHHRDHLLNIDMEPD